MKEWIPFINKLVWPAIIAILLLVYRDEAGELYSLTMDRIKAGGSIELGGFLKLGEMADETEIKELSLEDLSIEAIGGAEEAVTKGTRSALIGMREQLDASPSRTMNTLLVADDVDLFSVRLLKEYIGTLGLRYVVFQERGEFSGWMKAGPFVAQLPVEPEWDSIGFADLRAISGISTNRVGPGVSAKKVLTALQENRMDAIPVVTEDGRWLFFAERGEILSRLMTSVITEEG